MDVSLILHTIGKGKMLRLLSSLILLAYANVSFAGITLGATRVIYDPARKEATISLNNTDSERPYLIQSWVERSDDAATRAPFVITPPLFKLPPNSQNLIRIAYIGDDLPSDRESLFKLNVNAIPAIEKQTNNRMLIATKSVLKLIFRPQTLTPEGANSAINKITLTADAQTITMTNPTPYYLNIGVLKINGKNHPKAGYVAPLSNKTISVSEKVHQVSLIAINDYGGLTAERKFQF